MSIVLTQPDVSSIVGKKRPIIAAEAQEHIVVCPGCGTIETVWFTEDGLLVPTRKFHQYGDWLYHDCGVGAPCRLY